MARPIVFRFGAKFHTFGEIGAASAHNARTRETLHADPNLKDKNETLYWAPPISGSPDDVAAAAAGSPLDDIRRILRLVDPRRIRKNAVLAGEAIVTAHKDWFTEDDRNEQKFIAAFLPALKAKFGMRLANVIAHRDEEAFHLHVLFVPIESVIKDGAEVFKLNARGFIGGPEVLAQWQDWAGEIAEQIGLQRGARRQGTVRRRHISPKAYRARLEAEALAKVAKAEEKERAAAAALKQAHDEATSVALFFELAKFQAQCEADAQIETEIKNIAAERHIQQGAQAQADGERDREASRKLRQDAQAILDRANAEAAEKRISADEHLDWAARIRANAEQDRETEERISVAMQACLDRRILGVQDGKIQFQDEKQAEELKALIGCSAVLRVLEFLFKVIAEMADAWIKSRAMEAYPTKGR